MFGFADLVIGDVRAPVGAAAGAGGEPASRSPLSVSSRAIAPAPASMPPATSPRLSNVRRSIRLLCLESMFSMRGLILGAGAGLVLTLSPAVVTAAAAPSCAPATLDNSALQA